MKPEAVAWKKGSTKKIPSVGSAYGYVFHLETGTDTRRTKCGVRWRSNWHRSDTSGAYGYGRYIPVYTPDQVARRARLTHRSDGLCPNCAREKLKEMLGEAA